MSGKFFWISSIRPFHQGGHHVNEVGRLVNLQSCRNILWPIGNKTGGISTFKLPMFELSKRRITDYSAFLPIGRKRSGVTRRKEISSTDLFRKSLIGYGFVACTVIR